ncbi:unnamed protein product [Rhodiola kirilowii]
MGSIKFSEQRKILTLRYRGGHRPGRGGAGSYRGSRVHWRK